MNEILKGIRHALAQPHRADIGLHTGRAGYALFHDKLAETDPDPGYQAVPYLEDLTKRLGRAKRINGSYCSGLAGVAWLFRHFESKGYVTFPEGFFDDLDEIIYGFSFNHLQRGDYDFMHGGLGAVWYFLKRPDLYGRHIELLLGQLNAAKVEHDGVLVWPFSRNYKIKQGEFAISFGLSHGMPSIMVILARAYAAGIAPEVCSENIYAAYRAMEHYYRDLTPGATSFFPAMIIGEEPASYNSRVGWCYGDIGVAYGYYVAGTALGDAAMAEKGLRILDHFATIHGTREHGLVDSCICHGTTSMAMIYYNVYLKTGNPSYLAVAQRWCDVTATLARPGEPQVGFRYYMGEKGWKTRLGMLEGISGTGTALTTVQNGLKDDWAEAFLIY